MKLQYDQKLLGWNKSSKQPAVSVGIYDLPPRKDLSLATCLTKEFSWERLVDQWCQEDFSDDFLFLKSIKKKKKKKIETTSGYLDLEFRPHQARKKRLFIRKNTKLKPNHMSKVRF